MMGDKEMSFKEFLISQGMMIISAIIFSYIYRVTGIYKILKGWNLKPMSVPSIMILVSVVVSGISWIIIRIFTLSKYEYLLSGIFMGLIVSTIAYISTNNKKKTSS